MATITSVQSGSWQDTNTWDSGTVPQDGDLFIIERDHVVEVEGNCEAGTGIRSTSNNTSNAGGIVYGTLRWSRTNSSTFKLHGQLYRYPRSSADQCIVDIGTDDDPIPENVKHTININPEGSAHRGYYNSFYSAARSSTVFPKTYIKAEKERVRSTFLTAPADAGATQITVDNAHDWQVGDVLYLAPRYLDSDSGNANTYKDKQEFERATIQAINGNTITLTAALQYDHGYSIEKDKPAAVVQNHTSNIVFTSGGDANVFYTMRFYRDEHIMSDFVIEYGNNVYNYVSCPIEVVYAGYYGKSYIKRVAIWQDSRNINYYGQGLFYYYAVYPPFGSSDRVQQDDFALAVIASHSSRPYVYRALVNYYSMRNMIINNATALAGNGVYLQYAFDDYQQPVTYNNCKVVGALYAYNLHDNVDTDTNNCWAIGSRRATYTYNGTAIHRDLHIRWNYALGNIPNAIRGSWQIIRPDFEDRHLGLDRRNAFEYPSSVTGGDTVRIQDAMNDTNKQYWYYSGGRVYWSDGEPTRNDDHSIVMIRNNKPYSIIYKREFLVNANDSMLVGAYIQDLNGYDGTLTMRLKQGSDTITEQTFDLTTFTAGQWTLISISGEALRTATTTWEMEYDAADGKGILLTDFSQPFTADQKAQAKAVWAELLAENNVPGSYGQFLQAILDVAISTRASQVSVNAIPTNPLLTTDARLDHLDADVSSRSTYDPSTDRVDVGKVAGAAISGTDDLKADVSNLDVAVSTRLAASAYTAPDNAGIGAIKAQTDKLHFDGDNVLVKVADRGVLNDVSEGQIRSQTTHALSDYGASKISDVHDSRNDIISHGDLQWQTVTAEQLWKLTTSIEDDGSGKAVQVWRTDAGDVMFTRYLYKPDGSHVMFAEYPADAVTRRGP